MRLSDLIEELELFQLFKFNDKEVVIIYGGDPLPVRDIRLSGDHIELSINFPSTINRLAIALEEGDKLRTKNRELSGKLEVANDALTARSKELSNARAKTRDLEHNLHIAENRSAAFEARVREGVHKELERMARSKPHRHGDTDDS